MTTANDKKGAKSEKGDWRTMQNGDYAKNTITFPPLGGGVLMHFSVRGHAAKQRIVFKIRTPGQGIIFFKSAP